MTRRRESSLGDFLHQTGGGTFGPSDKGESLRAYRARVRGAYGSLRGVSFLCRWTREARP
jgi:hypothetical protein